MLPALTYMPRLAKGPVEASLTILTPLLRVVTSVTGTEGGAS